MRECKKCRVEILDDTRVCPLCSSVLEISGEPGTCTGYPDVKSTVRKLNFIVRLYSFLAIITEVTMIIVNYLNFHGVWWSAVSGICILYFYITLKYSLQKNKGYQTVIVVAGGGRCAPCDCGGLYCRVPGLVCKLCVAGCCASAGLYHRQPDDRKCL